MFIILLYNYNIVSYHNFIKRYAILITNKSVEKDEKKISEKVCELLTKTNELKKNDYQCGLTKVKKKIIYIKKQF